MITLLVVFILGIPLAYLLYERYSKSNYSVYPASVEQQTTNEVLKNKKKKKTKNHDEKDVFMDFEYEDDGTCVATINKKQLLKHVIEQIKKSYSSSSKFWHLDKISISEIEVQAQQREHVLIVKKGAPIFSLELEYKPEGNYELWNAFIKTDVIVHAPMDGYLEADTFYLDDGDEPLFKILPTEKIEEKVGSIGQTPLDDHYWVAFNGYEYYENFYRDLRDNFSKDFPPVLFTWNKQTGDFVHKGEIVGHLTCNKNSKYSFQIKEFDIKSRGDGFISIDMEKNVWGEKEFESPFLMYSLYKTEETFIEEKYVKNGFPGFNFILQEDVFDKSVSLTWEKVAGRLLPNETPPLGKYYNVYEMKESAGRSLFISFQIKNNFVYIVFSANSNEIRLSSGDEVSLLLKDIEDNEYILSYTISDDFLREDYFGIYDISYYCPLSISDIDALKEYECIHWKINLIRSHKPTIIGGNYSSWIPVQFASRVFQRYIQEFYEQLLKIECQYNLVFKSQGNNSLDVKTESSCYVYLMYDISNGYYKIGLSNNPDYRERTLQSEKPTIEKICAKEYPNRTIASAIESALHKSYDSKRLRGEWFALNDDDVAAITATLS